MLGAWPTCQRSRSRKRNGRAAESLSTMHTKAGYLGAALGTSRLIPAQSGKMAFLVRGR